MIILTRDDLLSGFNISSRFERVDPLPDALFTFRKKQIVNAFCQGNVQPERSSRFLAQDVSCITPPGLW